MRTRAIAAAAGVVAALAAPAAPSAALTERLGDVAHTVVTGAGAGTHLGETLAAAGDFDGDGVEDVLIGGRSVAFLVLGGAPGPLSTDDDRVVRLGLRELDPRQILAVAGPGDLDGDGFDDLLIGASRADPFGRKNAGSAFVVFGRVGPTDLVLDSGDAPRVVRMDGGDPGDRAARDVAGAGDVNGDGAPDVLVGAPQAGAGDRGAAFVVFGDMLDHDVDLGDFEGEGYRIHDPSFGRDVGYSVATAGDMNGDGYADLVVGAPSTLVTAPPAAYVVFGKLSDREVRLRELDVATGWAIVAGDDERQEGAGEAVDGGRDVSGDGIPDVVVGAPHAMGRFGMNGVAFVVFGKTGGERVSLDELGDDGYRIEAGVAGAELGADVALAPDLDGNGLADVLVSDPWERRRSRSGSTYGAVYHLVGQRSHEGVDVDRLGKAGVRYLEGTDGHAGSAVAAVGDFDGDGAGDLGAGVSSFDAEGASDVGAVHLFAPVAPPPYERPPGAMVVSYENRQRAKYGSYCWDGLCADKRPEFPRRRRAGAGDRAHYAIMFREAPDEISLTAYRELDEFGRPVGGTPIRGRTRPMRYFGAAPVSGHQIVFRLPEEPGDLYLAGFARWEGLDRGDVSWFSHRLLEERAAHTHIPGPPKAVLVGGGARRRGALSSYCWSQSYSNGAGEGQCADYVRAGPLTPERAKGGARARIRIRNEHRPDHVVLRFYRDESGGHPAGASHRVSFRLRPHSVDGEVRAWDVRFRLPGRKGHLYPTMRARWKQHGTAPYDWHLLLR